MLDRNEIAAASQTLMTHWRAGTKLGALEPSQRPHDRAEGYAIQAAIEQSSADALFGWKIAATSEAGQKHINVDGPMAGRILSETVIADGGTASMAGNEMRVGEPEFAFRMATRPAAAITALYGTGSSRRGRHTASGDRDSGFAVFRFRQCRRRADHRRQCLRASVRAGPADNSELARP